MKLFEKFNAPGYHTAIVTSFGVDFDAFESIALNRLRAAECRNVMLIADAGMLAMSLNDEKHAPKFAGSSYLVAKGRASGVFHPKLLVQLGRNGGRLIVASANATTPGFAGNLELAAEIVCGAEDTGERRLVQSAWNYATSFLDLRQSASEDKLNWARHRTPWLDPSPAGPGTVNLLDGTDAAFLATDESKGLAKRYLDLIGDRRRVERLVVLSPYWDDDLKALQELQAALNPRRTWLLVDVERQLFPAKAIIKGSRTQVSDIAGFDKKHFTEGNRRFVHAKMIVATIGRVDHVLMGSANCTIAALGGERRHATNQEACLYRRMPSGQIFADLGLDALLSREAAVDIAEIPKLNKQESLPPFVSNDPGTFEYAHEKLFWWPSSPQLVKDVVDGEDRLELLDASGKLIESKAVFFPNESKAYFRIEKSNYAPALARFRRSEGHVTGTAIVSFVEELRNQTKDPLPARSQRAVRDLESDAEESLWLLESILALSAPRDEQPSRPRAATGAARGSDKDPKAAKLFDFESFMRGRRRWTNPAHGERTWLSSSNVSLVRAFLNRGLGLIGEGAGARNPENESAFASALDRGDETGGDDLAVDAGFDPTDPAQSPKAAAALAKRRRTSDAAAIAGAVSNYIRDIQDQERILDDVDLLRLRAMLTIIVVAGWSGQDDLQTKPTSVQVLPRSDRMQGETWPRLLGRVLASMFSGPAPAIKRLVFDQGRDVIPDDALETWACCIWSASAALSAANSDPGCKGLAPYLQKLQTSVRSLLPLTAEEVSSPPFVNTVGALDQRFGGRLLLPPQRGNCLVGPGAESLAARPAAKAI